MIIREMANSDFLHEVYGSLEAGHYGWVCAHQANPAAAPPDVWSGRPYKGTPGQAALIDRAQEANTYYCTAVLRATDASEIARKREGFVRLAVLVLDDCPPDDVKGASYAIQTSPGKHQVGIFLDPEDPDCANRELVDAVMRALAARGRSNDGSGNGCVRYVRLPHGSNTKPRPAGNWQVRLEMWSPRTRWTLADACDAVGIRLDDLRDLALRAPSSPTGHSGESTKAGERVARIMDPSPANRAYHDSIRDLAASLIAGGMFPGAAVEHLRSLMDAARPTDPAEVQRWQDRRDEIPRAVESAQKYAPPERAPHNVTIKLGKPDAQPPGPLQPMKWAELAHIEPDPPRWRLDGWLPEGTVTLLAANGGVGKSNLSLQLAVNLTHGLPLMGIDTQPSRVLVLSGEDEARTVHFRVANVCADLPVPMQSLDNKLFIYDMTQHDCVLWRETGATQQMQWLADEALRTRADVIVIDNASDVFAANENDRAQVRGFMRALNQIAHHTGAAILLLAHVDKASVRGTANSDSLSTFSGSTAWNNSARSRWAMVRDDDIVTLRHEKCNLGPLQEELRLEFDATAKVFRTLGNVPGNAAARALVRNTQRAALLQLLVDACARGQRLSMSVKANNNAYAELRDEPAFPNQLSRAEFFQMLVEMRRDGLVTETEYLTEHRKKHRCIELTEVGRLRAAQGSGAPAMWRAGGQGAAQ